MNTEMQTNTKIKIKMIPTVHTKNTFISITRKLARHSPEKCSYSAEIVNLFIRDFQSLFHRLVSV